jgi:phenylalanyl-tRNA synthetase beta chain
MRFERGVDPEAPPLGAARAAALIADWCGAEVLRGAIDVGGAPPRRRIDVRASRARAVIGYDVSRGDVEDVFDRLGMAHEVLGDDVVRIEVPGYRVDVEREVDLIEEIVRVQGYDLVGSTLPPVRQPGGEPDRYAFRRRVRRSLSRAGVREVRLIPFVSDADLERMGDRDAVRVTNPLQADEGWLRTRLLPGLLKAARRNVARHVRSVAVFEASEVWRLDGESPTEATRVALVLAGATEGTWSTPSRPFDVFDAKGAVEALLADLGIPWSTGEDPGPPYHGGRSATVVVDGETVGAFGELHPAVAAAYELPGRIGVAELDADALAGRAGDDVNLREVPRFPPVRRDLAFTVPERTPAGAVLASLRAAAGELLGDAWLFDVHVGDPLPEGSKSLAFSIDLRAPDRTLTDAEAAAVVDRIVERLAGDFDARLRSG